MDTTTSSESSSSSISPSPSTSPFTCDSGYSKCANSSCCNDSTEDCVTDGKGNEVFCCNKNWLLCGSDGCFNPKTQTCCGDSIGLITGTFCDLGWSCCGASCCGPAYYCSDIAKNNGTCTPRKSNGLISSGAPRETTIPSISQHSTLPTTKTSHTSDSSFYSPPSITPDLTVGAKIGISIGTVLAALIAALIAYMMFKRKREKPAAMTAAAAEEPSTIKSLHGPPPEYSSGRGDYAPMRELDSNSVYELDGSSRAAELQETRENAHELS